VNRSSHPYLLFRKRLDAFADELPGVEQGRVEARHRARVASRRLRELLPLLGLGRQATRKLNRGLRTVTQDLGPARELDVLSLVIQELQRDPRYSPAALERLSTAVARARGEACERLAVKLPAAKLERLAEKLDRAVKRVQTDDDATSRRASASGPTKAWVWALDARLARRAARVRSAIDVAGAIYVPANIHEVRIALKKLRYAAELSRDAGCRTVAADLATLKTGQDLLGRLHDLEGLVGWARDVQAALSQDEPAADRELGSLLHAIETDCRQLHARYVRDRAKLIAIADRMGVGKPEAVVADRRAASESARGQRA
jgi:CHAD domain-containing protein